LYNPISGRVSVRPSRDLFGGLCRGFAWIWAVILIYPVLFVIAMSVSNSVEATSLPPWLVPRHFEFSNYIHAFSFFANGGVSIPTMLVNSGIVAASTITITLGIGVLAAYAFARMRFRGKRVLFYAVMLSLIVPIPALLIPEFITVKAYGLIGSLLSLILPYCAFGLPLPVLILTSFFQQIPTELYEAAVIDGASLFRTLRSVVLPLARPALATCVVFLGLQVWNEFSLALVVIQNASLSTVPLGLASVQGKGVSPWQFIAAGMLITSLPVVIVFFALQRQFIEGLMKGSVKA
jgi:raffinose/stachyose/melibiose transport system permease protein